MLRKALLLFAMLLMPAAARAEWYEASTPHFVVYSNDSPEKVRSFAANLERFDKTLRFLRNISEEPVGKANRVTIYVVANDVVLGRLAGSASIAGFYSPRAGGSVAFVPRIANSFDVPNDYKEAVMTPQQILLHEYTHHFLLSLNPGIAYPAWFVEGYAEFFATTTFEPDGSVIIGRPPQYRSFDLDSNTRLSMDRMLTADPQELTNQQRYQFYVRGWLLTHYLFLGGKRDGQLGAYFRALTEGKTPAEAAQAFGDLRKLESEIWSYKRSDFAGQRVAASVLKTQDVVLRKLGAGEAAVMDVRIESEAGVTPEEAKRVYARAKTICAAYPNDSVAQRWLAEAAFDAQDYAGAEAAADRAIAADPNNVEALLYKARSKMAVAVKAEDKTPATWRAIRTIIAAANKIDTENPKVLWTFFQSYTQAGMAPTKAAKDGLYYAFMLAPQDSILRFVVAETRLRDGQSAEARALLLTFVRSAHGASIGKLAARMVAEIDAGRPEGAIAELEKDRKEREDAAKKERK